jgi:hypothetical protein
MKKKRADGLSTGIDVGDIRLRMNQVQIEYPYFVHDTLTKLLQEHIIEKIQREMKLDKISKKIIESTRIGENPIPYKKKSIKWSIVSDYKSIDGFPVAVMIEHGRKAYFIRPKKPTPSRKNPTLRFENKRRQTVFSKGHWIPPYHARKYVYETVQENKKKIKRELNKKTHEFVREIMGETLFTVP